MTGYRCITSPVSPYLVCDANGHDTGVGTRIYFVDGTYQGDDKIGILMHDFRCADPAQMLDPYFASRMAEIKNSKEEISPMDDYEYNLLANAEKKGFEKGEAIGKAIGKAEGKAEFALYLMRDGKSCQEIAEITKLGLQDVEKIREEYQL